MRKKYSIAVILLCLCALFAWRIYINVDKKSKLAKREKIYRPVSVVKLKNIDPKRSLMLTGVVKTWKEENLSFEVPGRIEWVIEKGIEVDGGSHGIDIPEDGGTVIARLDPARYQLRLNSLRAKIKAAQAKAEAVNVSITEVMSRQLEAIDADFKNASQRYQRLKTLLRQQAVSRQAFDDVEAEYTVARAKQAEVKALTVSKKAELKALLALVEELKQQARDAELDIEKCTLRSPYKGLVVEVSANIGANVQVGMKVAKVVVMTPILVRLEVSANVDRELKFRQYVDVIPSGLKQTVSGMVNLKSTVADPHTHTFCLELLVQNHKIPIAQHLPDWLAGLPQIGGGWRVIDTTLRDGRNILFVESKVIFSDAKGEYVWKAERSPESIMGAEVYILKKVRVKLEPQSRSVMGVFNFRIFKKDEAQIKTGDFLALGVPSQVKSGDKVVDLTKRWLFRQGDLVKVLLKQENTPSGFYVPIEALVHEGNKDYVYLLKRFPGKNVARLQKVAVNLHNQIGSYQRISSPSLKDGQELVFKGVHFLYPDEEVVVKEIEEIKL